MVLTTNISIYKTIPHWSKRRFEFIPFAFTKNQVINAYYWGYWVLMIRKT